MGKFNFIYVINRISVYFICILTYNIGSRTSLLCQSITFFFLLKNRIKEYLKFITFCLIGKVLIHELEVSEEGSR